MNKSIRKKRDEKGMALLEVLIAMLVFALALLPLVKLQVMSMDATKAGFYKTETSAAAESLMDYLMTDYAGIFNNKWEHVTVTSGDNCNAMSSEEAKIACQILNTNGSKFHAPGNAVLCVFGKRPNYYTGEIDNQGDEIKKNHDQYLISIRAIWYSGKRQKSEKEKERHIFYEEDLKPDNCDEMTITLKNKNKEEKVDISKVENLDFIQINMAY